MSSATAKPFKRISSLVKLRSRQETPYQVCEDDELDGKSEPTLAAVANNSTKLVVEFPVLSPPESQDNYSRVPKLTCAEEEQSLVECFYIGSTDMTGLEIRGRGCIDSPAATIWEQSQDRKPKRKNSWTMKQHRDSTLSSSSSLRPRYVRLVTGAYSLLVRDNSTDELITEFSYRKISFVGTHPKYRRLLAFIAESVSGPPYCHAFKCEDKECAKQAACSLSDIFTRKIQELLKSKKIELTTSAEATVLRSDTPY